ncbi:MAG: carboxypeptidase regulatory-like domain-containing protein [Acidobacteriaceae bacterium]
MRAQAMRTVCNRLWPLVCVVLLSTLYSLGQVVNGTIVGTVADSSSAAIPDATVTVTDVNTNVSHSAQTDASGFYSVPDLAPGTYKVTARKDGFSTAINVGLTLFADRTVRADMTLKPGEVTETVSVSSAILPELQTDTADTGRDIETMTVEELPLSTGRNFQNLLSTVPGAGATVKDHSTFYNQQLSMSTAINGQSSMYNTFNIQGVSDNQRSQMLQIYIPPAEAIQEVQISSSNYDPQQGAALGAVTNVILKSGSNQFHGEGYYFYQGDALSAKSYFQTSAKNHAAYNYFGGNIGGPIQKDKMFFFVSFLEYRQHVGEFYQVSVPTAAIRTGDFSDPALTKIYDPMTGDTADCLPGGNAKLCGTGRRQFSYNGVLNMIPPSRLDPIALTLLSHVTMPNNNQNASGVLKYQNNLLTGSGFTQDTPDVDVTIDRFFSSQDHLFGRFSFERPSLNQDGLFGDYGGPLSGGGIAGEEGYGHESTYSIGVNWIHPFASKLLSEARFGLSRYDNLAYPTGYGKTLAQDAGIPGANLDAFTSGISLIEGEGFSDPMIGGCSNCPWTRAGTLIQAVENMTKVTGNHTLEWGADYHRWRDDLLLVGYPPGFFDFAAGTTALNGTSAPASGFANQFASFLLGVPNNVQRGYANVFPALRQNQLFVYFGDKWQASQKLTVNAGIRWEYYGPPTPHFAGGFSNYNPTTNSLELAGIGVVPRNMGLQPDYTNFGPRLGLDYRISSNSVVRAGFGISTLPWNIDLFAYNYPIEPSQSFSSLSSFGPAILDNNSAATTAQGFPGLPAYTPPANGILPANTPALLNQSYDAINLKWKNPYLEAWNFAYERTLPGNWVLDIAYVGNHGIHTPIEYNLNAATVYGQGAAGQPEYGPCAACGSPNANVGRTAGTTEFFAGYSSNYNALQIKFDHKFARGFAMTNSYAYGRALGFATEASDYPNGLLDYVNPRRNYAQTDFNQTHIFNNTFMWHLPFGKGAHLASSGVASQVLGGWELAGVWEATSGMPLNFSCTCASFNSPGNQAFPNFTGAAEVRKLHGIGSTPWFDTTAFAAPAAGTQGDVGNYISSGPRFFNLDASIFRRMRLTERFNLELRSEWLHATNTPQFTSPNTTYGSSSFGLVQSTNGGNRLINVAGKITF